MLGEEDDEQAVFGGFATYLGLWDTRLAPQMDSSIAGRRDRVLRTVGVPLTPFFFTQVRISGKMQWVVVQAFERRVLTMTADGLVEFGNIGQHYYQWRYAAGTQTSASPATARATTSVPVQLDFSPFAERWGHHGYQFVINADGTGHGDHRTYTDCTMTRPYGPPCEDPYTSYAGHTTVEFISASSKTVKGTILTSNDSHSRPVITTVTLTLRGFDISI